MSKIIKINEDFSYEKIKKLDMESEKKMIEATGPADECICNILTSPDDKRGIGETMRSSIKKAIKTMSGGVRRKGSGGSGGGYGGGMGPGSGVVIPMTTQRGGKGIYTSKSTLKRKKPCTRTCGCDDKNIQLKHSYANIRIITPDISSLCPCPNPPCNNEALNSIKVTVERLELHPDIVDSEESVTSRAPELTEPIIEKRSVTELINNEYDDTEVHEGSHDIVLMKTGYDWNDDNLSEWSFGIEICEEEEDESNSERDDDDEAETTESMETEENTEETK